MLHGFRVSDVDIHIVEPVDLWQKYIDPAFAEEAPKPVNEYSGSFANLMMVAGSLAIKVTGTNRSSREVSSKFRQNIERWHGDLVKMGWSPEAQILGMDREGIDLAFLYPSTALNILANDDISPDLALAITQAYNDWLDDLASYNRGRMIHIAAVPLQSPQSAVNEAKRCARKFGTRGVFLRGEPLQGRTLDNPAYEILWETLENLEMAVGLHFTAHSLLPTLGAHRFSTRFQSQTLAHPMEQMSSLVALIGSGVMERHPKLRVAFLESGGGWLPYMLWRFNEQYDQLAGIEAPGLTMKPSDYFERQCWISIESNEPHLNILAECLGEDRTVISSDFPHGDHAPGGLRKFAERQDLSKTFIEKTFWHNTMNLYSMKDTTPKIIHAKEKIAE